MLHAVAAVRVSGGRARQATRALSVGARSLLVHRVVPYAPLEVFRAVADIQQYPQFLPYCRAARTEQRSDTTMLAQLDFEHSLVSETVGFEVSWQTPERVLSVARDTKYCREVAFEWTFREADAGRACDLSMALRLDFRNPTTAMLFDAVASPVQDRIMDAFLGRVSALSN